MLNRSSLRSLGLVGGLCMLLAGCTALRTKIHAHSRVTQQAKFKGTAFENTNADIVFAATEEVFGKYFSHLTTRDPKQGLLSTEKSKMLEGHLAEDQHQTFATATVKQTGKHTQHMMKVQRTKRVGAWSWWGLGTTYYEREIPAGSDDALFERIRQEIRDTVKKAKASPSAAAAK